MTRRVTPVEMLEDAFKKADYGEKWYRYFAALAQRQSRLVKRYRQTKQRMEHFEAKYLAKQEECAQNQARVVKLKSALETEAEAHAQQKQLVKKLQKQLQGIQAYVLEGQDERTVDLIHTICSPRQLGQLPSTATLGNKSGSLLDDSDENSISSMEGSISTESQDDQFVSLRKETKPDCESGSQPEQQPVDSNATSASTGSSSSEGVLAPLREQQTLTLNQSNYRKRLSSDEDENVTSKRIKRKSSRIAALLTVSVDENARIVAESRIDTKPSAASGESGSSKGSSRRRSKSVDARLDGPAKPALASAPSEDELFKTPNKLAGSPMYRSNSASKLTNKQHHFITKTVIAFENCAKCKRRMKFYREALRCVDCNLAVHQECREDSPLPCIPSVTKTPVKGRHKLSEFCPQVGPRVPPLLINCFHELEKNHRIREIGLYRMSGARTEIQSVVRKLQKSVQHDLSQYDTHVITGVVKDFLLNSLSEPLVPSSMYNRFVKTTEPDQYGKSDAGLRSEVEGLPPCNRDTLAYVMLHIRVVEQIADNRMDRECLTKVFAPTIVGYSLQAQMNPALMNQELTQRVMGCLLAIEPSFWDAIIQRAHRKATRVPSKERTPMSSKTPIFASPKIS
ncbi:rac GTPase-activating protein 1-like [Tropilaelaps mercedesae]|uniref:Rac GTPase-activating protein 1-like n=1 Tax=Tropilaelaps mercedesae TaxID=418985 RepID=A0A1V9XD09_9ACAR|nr:rac GTPase-activating protein 1-like [Tropilaelaps mercedesae]